MSGIEAPKGPSTSLHIEPSRIPEYKGILKDHWERSHKEEAPWLSLDGYREQSKPRFIGYVDVILSVVSTDGNINLVQARKTIQEGLDGYTFDEHMFQSAIRFYQEDEWDSWKS